MKINLKHNNLKHNSPKQNNLQLSQQQLINLMEQWHNTDPAIYKTNIKKIADSQNIKPKKLKELLQVSYHAARSYTNPAHIARIEFITALKLANMLNVSVTDFLKN